MADHEAHLTAVAIFVPSPAWHWEMWGFALQFALDSGCKVVHFHVKNNTLPEPHRVRNPRKWQAWHSWLALYTSQGLFPDYFAVKIDADFDHTAYDLVLVQSATEQWNLPHSWERFTYASEYARIAQLAKSTGYIVLRWVWEWKPRNVLFFVHGLESPAPTWNHLKIRNYHRRYILTCFRGIPVVRQRAAGTILVVARGGDENILRQVAKLPFVSLRIVCDVCEYDIPEALLVKVDDEEVFGVRDADAYLVARSGSYTKEKLNGAIPIAVSFLVPVIMPFEMAFDMGYDGNRFLLSYTDKDDLKDAVRRAAEVNRSEYEAFRNQNVEHNNKLFRAYASDMFDHTLPVADMPYLKLPMA